MSIHLRSGANFYYRPLLLPAILILAMAATFGCGSGSGGHAEVDLLETGSSLMYPIFNLWVPAYQMTDRTVRITTQSTGSGAGISQAIEDIAQIGASDAYMNDALMKQHPDMLNIPLCIASQMVTYNIPGLNRDHLRLSGPVLAAIYQGTIAKWNDPAIARINPGVPLPADTIVPLHRTDGSGDTFIFTQYLAFSTPDWAKTISYGTAVSWPAVSSGIGAIGNPGMITGLSGNPYSVAYVGASYQAAIEKNGFGIAMLENRDGAFVLPNNTTVAAAAAAMAPKTPKDQRISLVFAPGKDSYPIVNYEYAIVKSNQRSEATASALRKFFTWAISPQGGNSPHFMEEVHFVPLPPPIVKLSQSQIAGIN